MRHAYTEALSMCLDAFSYLAASISSANEKRLAALETEGLIADNRLISALNAIPDLRFRVYYDRSLKSLFAFVDLLPRPRIVLDFVRERSSFPIRLPRCDRLSSATEIVILDTVTSINIVISDASARVTTMRLFDQYIHTIDPRGEHAQEVDWTLISSLDSLTTLRVDASIWCLVMEKFPRSPSLANTILRVADPGSLDSLRSPIPFATALDNALPVGLSIGIPQLAAQLGVDDVYEDERPRAVPKVPAGSSLTISADTPVSIAGWCVGDVMDLLGVEMVKLDGVVMEGDRARSEQALSCDNDS
ncbi:hypothetical protein AURDEDRAFT_165849 [Auricularia subglabra TFB-10046 SS5]|nr:hypothetical protein AURDEDRAFT_165849 [Auricularia subglabra TFB-10046 SS5]